MVEFFSSGIFGGLIGGAFRLIPEVVKYFDKKDERKHELAMFSQQCDLEKQRGAQKLAEIGAAREAATDVGMLEAFKLAIQQQTEMAVAAGGWAATLSAAVRPITTFYLLGMYGLTKTCFILMSIMDSLPVMQAITSNWTTDDMALLNGVINYWMLDRSLAKRGL